MSDDGKTDDEAGDKPRNRAPDAVKDPTEKTDGKPGEPPPQDGNDDPGAG